VFGEKGEAREMQIRRRALVLVILFVSTVLFIVVPSGCNCAKDDTSPSVNETLEKLQEKYKDSPELFEAALYAEHFGTTIEEAQNRFEIGDAFSGLDTELENKEPETFGGLWIQHEPSFCVVIAFTRDGEATIKKYISENLTGYVEVRTVKYSMKELWKARNQVEAFLRGKNIPFDSGIYVIDNRVEIDVTDRTEIDKAIEDGRLIIPECVRITVVSGLSVPE
jgi:hypothetical protein